jgi:integrase
MQGIRSPARSTSAPDLATMLDSWERALKGERKSPQTIKSYRDGVRKFLTWCDQDGHDPVLDRATVSAFLADLLDQGAEATTARVRQQALRRFSWWLHEEEPTMFPVDHLAGITPVKLDSKVIEPLTDDDLKALLKACAGAAMKDRRDAAIVRLMVETGARAGEVAAMRLSDVDLRNGSAIVRRGKGGAGRTVPFGPQTVLALDRYIRARRTHKLASTDALWLGGQGSVRTFTYYGLHRALNARAKAAGIENFHPHLLRHTAASRWLAAGGSEGGLMAVAGWSGPQMLQRYTKARASERAAEEARKLNLGDW